MTTTTYDALTTSNGCAICYVAIIEGYPYALTDGDPTQVLAACTGGLAGHDVLDVLHGLCVMWDQRDRADPWKPITDPPALRFRVVPGCNTAGAVVDTFGRDVFRRTAAHETYLRGDIDQNDTTITVASTSGFASSGVAYIGGEAFTYSGVTATTFTGVTRATYAPFQNEAGAAFSRTHKTFDPASMTGDPLGVHLQPIVSSTPRNGIVGRQVGIWILLKTATGYTTTTQGHLAFAGVIAEASEDESGATNVAAEEIRRKVYETPLLRDQFKAKIAEGIVLKTSMPHFTLDTWRDPTQGDADDLVIVSGAPASANEIQAGLYTASEIGDAIQAWLQSEKAAARILFNVRYTAMVPVDGGWRAMFEYEDPTTTANISRNCILSADPRVLNFLGWGTSSSLVLSGQIATASKVSPEPPVRTSLREDLASPIPYAMTMENASGTWIDQSSILPAAVAALGYDGVIKIGGLGYAAAAYSSDTSLNYAGGPLLPYLPLAIKPGSLLIFTVEDDAADLEVCQVILGEAPFSTLLLKILASTGTASFNSATYDTLSEGISCGIPWSLLDGLDDDIANVAEANRLARILIEKPTRFSDVFASDLQLRWAFLSWSGARLRMRAWSTPVAAYATLALTEAMKAVPAAQASGDKQRSSSAEPVEAIYNDIKISYGRDPDGNYTSSLEVADAPSIRDHGARALTIEARNAAPTDIVPLIAAYAAGLPMHTRPRRIVRRTIDRQRFELAAVGTLVTISDRHVRNPETGLRYDHTTALGGLIGWPGIIVGTRFDWGGPEGGGMVREAQGEIDVMIFDRVTHAPYSPAAQVDDTQANAGYDAGTGALTCYAHEHSESTASTVDATRFIAGDKIVIVEIDPSTAASPTTWSRTIATVVGNVITPTVTLSSPAWDAAKKYRIISAAYASAVATQQTDSYQADDADGLVVDVRQPYGMIYSGAGQSSVFTVSPSTEIPARYATLAIGDGKPYDVAYDRDIARGLNNLIDYKTTPQCPTVHEDADTFSGAGAYQLVRSRPLWIGQGQLPAGYTIKLAAAPEFKSTDGSTATVRLTLSKFPPEGDTCDDVLFPEPYVQVSFTRTATTYAIATAQDIDTRHLNRGENGLGGVGWLSVEITDKTSVIGVGHLLVGERESA